jgi:hypothetical protein
MALKAQEHIELQVGWEIWVADKKLFINVGVQAEYWKKTDVSGCSILFNLIK